MSEMGWKIVFLPFPIFNSFEILEIDQFETGVCVK